MTTVPDPTLVACRTALAMGTLLLLAACSGGEPPPEPDATASTPTPAPTPVTGELARILECHDDAVGGDRLRAADRVTYQLRIVEPTFTADAEYVATRDGTARIDVFIDGERVFSEGWDGTAGWQLPGGALDTIPTSPEGSAALRHGVEQPGHL